MIRLRPLVYIFILAALTGIYSLLVEPNLIRVKYVDINDPELSRALKDLRIIFFSDLDMNMVGYRERSLVEKVNSLKPDIIFFSGGFAEGADYRAVEDVIKKIKAKLGIWAVLGDEDYRHGNTQDLIRKLEGIGVHVLRNETAEIRLPNGYAINVIGLDDPASSRDNLTIAAKGKASGMLSIILTHSAKGVISKKSDAFTVNAPVPKKDQNFHGAKNVSEWSGWEWEPYDYDGAEKDILIHFEKDGIHTLRGHIRECGIKIDRIVLKAVRGVKEEVNPEERREGDIVIDASDILKDNIFGTWKKNEDSTAYCRYNLDDNFHYLLNSSPVANPETYFEARFNAGRAQLYRVYIRRKTHSDCNGSLWLQFSDSLDNKNNPRYRIGHVIPRINANLILAGHTHGGQLIVPWWRMLDVKEFDEETTRYIRGLFKIGESTLYVTNGVGLSHVLPARFLVRPEIAVLRFQGISAGKTYNAAHGK